MNPDDDYNRGPESRSPGRSSRIRITNVDMASKSIPESEWLDVPLWVSETRNTRTYNEDPGTGLFPYLADKLAWVQGIQPSQLLNHHLSFQT